MLFLGKKYPIHCPPMKITRISLYRYELPDAAGGLRTRRGKRRATDTPGLGVTPDYDSLGAPVAIWGETA